MNKIIYRTVVDGEPTTEYSIWYSMVRRCDPVWQRSDPRRLCYVGCTLHDEWRDFQNFASWVQNQIGFEKWPEFQLDKDILGEGNKIYGPDTCAFIPASINKMLGFRQINGSGLPGVSFCKQTGRWLASIRIEGVKKSLGRFPTPDGVCGV